MPGTGVQDLIRAMTSFEQEQIAGTSVADSKTPMSSPEASMSCLKQTIVSTGTDGNHSS